MTKRIAILLPTLNVGGAEVLILEEMKNFSTDNRVIFEIIVLFEPGLLYEKVKSTNVKIKKFNAKHTPLSHFITYLKTLAYLRKNKFDILHIHLQHDAVLIGKLAGVPQIYTTVHNYRYFSSLERFFFKQNDKIFGCGKTVTNYLKTFIPTKYVACINNGINPDIDQDKQRLIKIKKNEHVLISVGRLSLQKGYEYLIEAMLHVVEKYPNVRLFIAGDGKFRNILEEKITNYALNKNVILLGHVDDVISLMLSSDIYINSSIWEGLPITMLEAMKCSLPIIATNIKGNRSIIKHQKNGLLITPKDSEELARTINELIENDTLKKQLGKRAFQDFMNKYTIDRHCEELLNEYGINR